MRTTPTINSGSMADIAFTLLIFFLVTTTLATEKGKTVLLPPWVDCNNPLTCEQDYPEIEILSLEITNNGILLLEGNEFPIKALKEETITFLLNNNANPLYSSSYSNALVLIKTNQNTAYSAYLEVYSNVREAFTQIREEASFHQFNKSYDNLNIQEAKQIRKEFPLKIAEQTIE